MKHIGQFILIIFLLSFKNYSIASGNNSSIDALNSHKFFFVKVSYHLKKTVTENDQDPEKNTGNTDIQTNISYFVDLKKTLDACGYIIDSTGMVITGDQLIDPLNISKIICENNGVETEYEMYSIFESTPLVILKPKNKITLKSPDFLSISEKIINPENLKTINFEINDEEIKIKTGALYPSLALRQNSNGNIIYYTGIADNPSERRDLCLVTDSQYRPIGITCSSFLDITENKPLWKINDLINSQKISTDNFENLRASIKKMIYDSVYKVKFIFRKNDNENDFNSYGRQITFFDGQSIDENSMNTENAMTFYGYAYSAENIFVPVSVNKALVKKVDRIEVYIDETIYPASLSGVFRDFTGFVVSIDTQAFSPFNSSQESSALEKNQFFYTVNLSQKSSFKNLDIFPNRFFSLSKKYNNILSPSFSGTIENGALTISCSGIILGINLRLLDENYERKKFEKDNAFYYPYDNDSYNNFYQFNEFQKIMAAQDSYFDKRIKTVGSKSEEKTKFWFGVEFQPVTKEYAQISKSELVTRDGKIGLLIGLVYPNSPAAGLGLKPGDLLLKLKEKSGGDWIELSVPESLKYSEYPFFGQFSEAEFENAQYGFNAPKPWLNQNNYLNMLIETFREGDILNVQFFDGISIQTDTIIVQQSPPDFESSKKYKNKELGLTVKDLTYEARAALKIADKQECVIVSEVEPGSPAAIARLSPYDVIFTVDGKEVPTIDDFKNTIISGLEIEKKKKIEIVLFKLGRTKITHINTKTE